MNNRIVLFVAVTSAATLGTPVAMGTLIDAFGDAQDTFGAGGPLLDVNEYHVTYDDTTLYIELTFHTPISAPSLFLPDGVLGNVEFDVDQNVATGIGPLQNVFSPPFAFLNTGVDFFINLGHEGGDPGMVSLIDAVTFTEVAFMPITYGPMSLSTSISLALLNDDDGIVDFTSTIGTVPQPTDATDVIGTSTAVPAPSMLALLALTATRRRRQRA